MIIEIQDHNKDIYYPMTKAEFIILDDGSTLKDYIFDTTKFIKNMEENQVKFKKDLENKIISEGGTVNKESDIPTQKEILNGIEKLSESKELSFKPIPFKDSLTFNQGQNLFFGDIYADLKTGEFESASPELRVRYEVNGRTSTKYFSLPYNKKFSVIQETVNGFYITCASNEIRFTLLTHRYSRDYDRKYAERKSIPYNSTFKIKSINTYYDVAAGSISGNFNDFKIDDKENAINISKMVYPSGYTIKS